VSKRHVVLIGLPGSGKTTVGRIVAEQLQATFVDVDTVLIRREGKPIAMIFAEQGEVAFRELERKAMETALTQEPAIVSPGGGWAAQPDALQGAKAQALVVYLRTRPDTATERAAPEGTRPLLLGQDAFARMRALLREREAAYLTAHEVVDTDRKTPAQIAAEIARLAQSKSGW
jgi:shikimate kinase